MVFLAFSDFPSCSMLQLLVLKFSMVFYAFSLFHHVFDVLFMDVLYCLSRFYCCFIHFLQLFLQVCAEIIDFLCFHPQFRVFFEFLLMSHVSYCILEITPLILSLNEYLLFSREKPSAAIPLLPTCLHPSVCLSLLLVSFLIG